MIHKRSPALELSVKLFLILEGLNRFHGANLTLNSDVDQDIDLWFALNTPNLSMHKFREHINQHIKRR